MDDATKEMAKKKARGMVEHIGYPSGINYVTLLNLTTMPKI
jgi:hypothetical protein